MIARYFHVSQASFVLFCAAAATVLFAMGYTTMSVIPREPEILSRSAWKAEVPNNNASGEHGLYDANTNPDGWLVYRQPLENILKTIVIHHSALPLTDGPLQIQFMHMHKRGFADIGYHFVIDQDGQIFEGRSIFVRGAHTAGHNTGTIGVVLLGNLNETPPTENQIESMESLLEYLVWKYKLTHLAGHREFQPEKTVCPGKYLEALLPDLAEKLGLTFGIAGYVGPTAIK